MRRNSNIYLVLTLFIGALSACEKNEIKYGDFDLVSPDQAQLKINNVSNYATNPSVYLAIDGKRVSNNITARTPFPGGGYNTGGGSTADYLTFAPGKHTFSLVIPQKVNPSVDSVTLFTTEVTLNAAKRHSLHITDTATNTQALLLEDDGAKADSGFVKYKFVHLMPNVPAIDLYFGTNKVADNIAYKGSVEFTMPQPAVNAAWTIREAGVTATSLATYTSASTITNTRSYCVFALGYKGQADAARKPYVSFYLIR